MIAKIIDIIEMKESLGLINAPGVVAVLDSCLVDPDTFLGKCVKVCTSEGRGFFVVVDNVRNHGTTVSLFFFHLSRVDIPVGSFIELAD